MDGQDKTGYNYEEITNLFNKINDIANDTKSILSKYLNEEVIDHVSIFWCAPEAKHFFKSFQKTVNNEEKNIDKAFQSLVDKIDLVQKNWSITTEGGEISEKINIQTNSIFLNVAKIKEQCNGNIFIKEKEALSFAESLTSLRETIIDDIKNQETLLKEASIAFMGNDQGIAIQSCFEKVLKTVDNIFDFLTVGDNSLKQTVIDATNEYRRCAKMLADEMNGE